MRKKIKKSEDIAGEVKEAIEGEPVVDTGSNDVSFDKVISTGSTLLDLAISGKRIRGGGIPAGIIVEFFGPSGVGKTALLAEACASAQAKGGEAYFQDPEARLDMEYSRIYGMDLKEKGKYGRPDTVMEFFDNIRSWKPSNPEAINVVAGDSLTALSTKMELEDKDEYGMRRAKEFSQELRKTCRMIRNNNWIILCSNQIRGGAGGEFVPGGHGIPFYSSVRIRVGKPASGSKIKSNITLEGSRKSLEKIIGIKSTCIVKKNTVDDPYREANIYIIFGYGIDDIRGNLMFIKEVTGNTKYDCVNKEIGFIDKAIAYIEENDLEKELREKTIDLWLEIEDKFRTKVARKQKRR